jgi:hypothetical protein
MTNRGVADVKQQEEKLHGPPLSRPHFPKISRSSRPQRSLISTIQSAGKSDNRRSTTFSPAKILQKAENRKMDGATNQTDEDGVGPSLNVN